MTRIESAVQVLSPDEVLRIHDTSLRILAHTGVHTPHSECLGRCREAGAEISGERIRLPRPALERMLAAIRQKPATGVSQPLEGRISTQVYVVDYAAKTRRPGLLDDVLRGIALVEHLPAITTSNAVVVPSDVPRELSDIRSFELIYAYASKPGGTYVLSPFSAHFILDMARLMQREVPFLLDTVSPLQFQAESLEIAAMFAAAGQPITISPMVMAGGTGPVTLAGTLALANAEALASLFVVYALTGRGAPYTVIPHSLDLRSALCSFGSLNQALLGVAVAQMARFYGLRGESNVGLSDALSSDFQCGCEKGASALMGALAGLRAIGAQGIAGADQGFSFEQLVLDNEWIESWNSTACGITVDAESLAEELIERIGPGGSFLAEEHTARHMRASYRTSKLWNRDGWDRWHARGGKDAPARAAEFVLEATRGYATREPVCSPAQHAALQEIRRAAEDALTSPARTGRTPA